ATEDEIESAEVEEKPTTEGVSESSAKTVPVEKQELEEKANGIVEMPEQKAAASTEEKEDRESAEKTSDDVGATESDQGDVSDTETCGMQTKTIAWEDKDIHEVANVVAGAGEKVPDGAVAALAGKLAQQGEYALAYHLISNAGLLFDMKDAIPAWVYGSVACGNAIQGTDQSANALLQGFFQQYHEQLFDELEGTDRMAASLLLAASGIEPALFYPITGAASVLQTLHLHKLLAFETLVKAVAEYGSRGVGLPRSALFSTISADELKQKREALQADAKVWLVERAPQFEIISRPGKDTWRAWIAKSGPVGSMLNPVIAGQTAAIPEIQALAEKYANSMAVDQEARRLFHKELKYRGEILRPALNMVRRHTAEAIDIVNEWISVVESQPASRQRFDEKKLAQLRKCFVDHKERALAELKDLSGESWPVAVRAGAHACSRVVVDVARVLEGIGTQSGSVRNAHRLLHDDLLRVPSLQLEVDGSPRLPDYSTPTDEEEASREIARKVVKGIAISAAEGLPTMQAAARMRGELGDHEGTGEILKYLEMTEAPDSFKRLEQERDNSIDKHKAEAKEQLTQGHRALSDALTKGLYAAQEYERWAVQIESAERNMRASGFLRFTDVYAVCEKLNTELSERKTREIARLRKEIDRINPSEEQRSRLDDVLSGGDVHTATDYLDRIRNQIELPDALESEAAPFIQFFGKGDESACELIERELKETNPGNLVDRVKHKKQVPGLQLAEMQSTQAKEAAEFLQLWFMTKTARELKEPNCSSIFSFFGMRPKKTVKVPQSKSGGHRVDILDLQVETLDSRDVCPCAVFGSGAHGNYKVVGYWLRPAVEDILQHTRKLGGGTVIVLYFG
ncbi:MAG: hypothetical protein WCJ49_05165, partial [Deltaproteobacteria bacterium]